MKIKILILFLVTAMLMPSLAFAQSITEPIVAESFDSVKTNAAPATLSISGAPYSRVVTDGSSNKVYMIEGNDSELKMDLKYTAAESKYVISMDIKSEKALNGSLSLTTSSAAATLFNFTDGVTTAQDGKRFNAFGTNKFVRISAAINKTRGVYSIYADNKCVLSEWKLPLNGAFTGLQLKLMLGKRDKVYVDNLYVYPGAEPDDDVITEYRSGYSPEGVEFVPVDDDLGDLTFFDSNWVIINSNPGKYFNANMEPKTNEIIAEKFDYKNPNKGDRIIFKKSTADDLYMDITPNVALSYRSGKIYKYYAIGGEVMCDFNGGADAYVMIRDTKTTGSQQNSTLISFDNTGNVSAIGGGTKSGACSDEVWFNFKIYLNLQTHKVDVFVNDSPIADQANLNANFNTLNLVRFAYKSGEGQGEMQLRNAYVKGMDKPFEGTEIKTSMFRGDEDLKEYMTGKTAFHAYGEVMYTNGSKIRMTSEPVYDNGEIYVSAADFNSAMGTEAEIRDGAVVCGGGTLTPTGGFRKDGETDLLPVMEVCRELLGKYTFDDTAGMVLVSDEKMYFDLSEVTPYHLRPDTTSTWDTREWMSDIQFLNDFILFDRPSRDELLTKFNESTENGAQHPRVYANKTDFERIRELAKTDKFLKSLIDSVIKSADNYAEKEPLSFKYDDHVRTLNTANETESRMYAFGIAYQLTGEQKYVDAAWKNFEGLNDFPDFNPSHPIDLGSYMSGVAIGYDWLYEGYTQEQRDSICANAKRLGLSVLDEGFYGGIPARTTTSGYSQNTPSIPYKWISNYNLWINRGAMISALAFMEYDEELCTDLLWHTLRSTEYGVKGFFPDGAWQESTSYWEIAARIVRNFYGLTKIFGTDFNLSKMPGFSEAGRYYLSLCSPLIGNYNYHDSWPSAEFSRDVFSIFDKQFNQPELSAARKISLTAAYNGITKTTPSVWDVLMYEPEVKVEDIAKMPKVKLTEGAELFAVHEDWMKPNGMFFASHGGPVKCYHYHEDAGDFAFELDGVRWACALGAEDYNSSLTNVEKYRWRAEGHNVVVINNSTDKSQNADAYAPVIRYEEGIGGAYAVYDMTDVYADADSYRRGFYIDDNFRSLTVRDEIKLNKSSEIYWFMHTQANAQVISDNSVLLTSGDKSVILTFNADGASAKEISVMDAVPLESSPAGTGQNSNKGYRKVAIRLSADSNVNLSVNVSEFGSEPSMLPIDEWTAPALAAAADNSDYGFSLTVDGEAKEDKSVISIYDINNLPDIQFKANDASKTIEVELSDKLDRSSKVKIYNEDKSQYKMYMIPYKMNYAYPGGEYDASYNYSEIAGFDASSEQDGNPAINMFDGNLETRWTTLATDESVVLDIGSEKAVDAVSAGFWQSDKRVYSFELYYSTDGKNFTQIGNDTFASTLAPEGQQIFSFDRVNARYLKYVGKGNSANVNSNVLEFRVLTKK